MSAIRRTEERPLIIELYGEAKSVALYLASENKVSAGDVVARGLGLLWFAITEGQKGRRIVTEKISGEDRRPISIG